MIAAQHSHLAVVRRLLQAGADTQKLDSEGRSVMQLAAGPTLTAVMEAETDARLAELETLEATCSSSEASWLAELRVKLAQYEAAAGGAYRRLTSREERLSLRLKSSRWRRRWRTSTRTLMC